MASSEERKALNEALFREANERLDQGARELVGADEDSRVPFLCECSRPGCTEVVLLDLSEYERVRSGSTQGVALAGHEDESVERVVARNDRFVVTEKVGRAGEVYGGADPRR